MYMIVTVALRERIIVCLIGKKRLHTGNLKLHLDTGREAAHQ